MVDRQTQIRRQKAVSPVPSHPSGSIIHHPLSLINPQAFTLIELLVVISILVMLMAVLLPTVERARRQARASACLARAHQWSLVLKMYTDTHGGRWFDHPISSYTQSSTGDWKGTTLHGQTSVQNWLGATALFWSKTEGFTVCPGATRERRKYDALTYDAFTAWRPGDWGPASVTPSGELLLSPISYAVNYHVAWPPPQDPRSSESPKDFYWGTCDVRGAGTVPVFFDTAWYHFGSWDFVGPPPFDTGLLPDIHGWPTCINRHDGGVNMLFMDWSVRKVGLKELWTLKWHRQFNTVGAWTARGGVEAEDWPQWMRRFKDY